MDARSPLLAALLVLAAAAASGGAAYAGVRAALPEPPPASTPEEVPAASGDAGNWSFTIQANVPSAPDPADGGTVTAILTRTGGDAALSHANGSIPVELAGVVWDPREGAPPGTSMLDAINAAFAQSPPLALARSAMSRSGDAVELTVLGGLGVRTIVVNAPLSSGFLIVAWPTGESYAWAEQASAWVALPGPAPTLVATAT